MHLHLFCSLKTACNTEGACQDLPNGWMNEIILEPQFWWRDHNSTVLNKNNSQTGVWILKSVWGYILISRNCCSKSWHLPKNIHGNHSGKAHLRGNVRRKTRKWKITFYWSGNTSHWARYTTNSHTTAAQGQKHLQEVTLHTAQWDCPITNSNRPGASLHTLNEWV